MDAIPELPGAEAEPGAACDLLAHAAVRVAPDAVPGLRQKPGPGVGEKLPASLLKHADEQTVAGLAAVLQAIDRHGLAATRFTDWGVLGAPRFIGRVALAATMHRFATEGAWGISPHLIPHRSLHALSGTVSQALKVHGPNHGVGGGPRGAAEALRSAVGLLADGSLPGLWVVLTGWEPEPIPERDGRGASPAICHAVALALAPASPRRHGLRLRLDAGRHAAAEPADGPVTVETLAVALEVSESVRVPVAWALGAGGQLWLERAGAVLPAPHLFRLNGAHGPRAVRGVSPGSKP